MNRRNFFRFLAGAASAVGLGSSAASSPPISIHQWSAYNFTFSMDEFNLHYIRPAMENFINEVDRQLFEYAATDWRKVYWVRDPHLDARRLPA